MRSETLSTLAVLKAARELISTPERWVQGPFAVDRQGLSVSPLSPDACAFCAIGATWRIAGTGDADSGADRELDITLGGQLANGFNDAEGRTHAEVLDLFDRTIARLESEVSA